MKSFVFKGTLKSSDDKSQQVIDINMPQNGLSIRGLTKSILEVDKNLVPEDNGVYVLESEDKCYVGQSKNLRDRLKNHFTNNKINHSRIFFLHKKDDIRGYLDYMEKRLFKSMDDEGYDLANGTNLDPELDRLDIEEKRLVDTWINEFLTFLPILGFRKEAVKKFTPITETPLLNKIDANQESSLKNTLPESENIYTRESLIELIKQCKYEELKRSGILTKTFNIDKESFVDHRNLKPAAFLTNNYMEKFYYIMDYDRVTLERKVKQIESLLSKLDIVNQHFSGSNGDKNTRDTLRELIKQCSFEKLEKSGIITTTFDIKREPFVNKFTERPAEELVNKYGETVYYILHFDSKTLERKIGQVKSILQNEN